MHLQKRKPMGIRSMIEVVRGVARMEDGLTSFHVADFLSDPKFLRAYAAGEATGSWHRAKLRWRVYTCCWAAEHALSIAGDFVECGVNRGGISTAVMEYVRFAQLPRKFYLLDTFCGDPNVAAVNQCDYSDCYEDVKKRFSKVPNAVLVRGTIPETLPQVRTSSIAFMSIDLNSAAPEIAALRYFWPALSKGAAVVLDDYAYSPFYAEQKAAMDSLGAELGFSVLTLPTGQGLIIK